MLRLAALGLACSFGFATPTLAVPVTFVPIKNDPSLIEFNCTPTLPAGSCGLKDPTFSFGKKSVVADPDSTFRFLTFKPNSAADSSDSNGSGDTDEENEDDDAILSGTFTTTVTLFLKAGGSDLISLISTGNGSFTTEDGAIRTFQLFWSPIANFTVDGVGTFSAAFKNIDLVAASGSRGEDDGDREWEDAWKKGVKVSATITPVPLPAGAWLLLSGLAVLGAARLRRRAAA